MNTALRIAAIALASFAPLCGYTQTAPETTPAPIENTNTIFQGASAYRTWSIGLNAGVLMPGVLLGGPNDFTNSRPSFGYGLYIQKDILHMLSVRADFMMGTLMANNDDSLGNGTQPTNPFNDYETDINWSGSLSAVVNIANINWMARKNVIQLYASAGLGYMSYNPVLQNYKTEKFDYKPTGSITELFAPIGVGAKIKLSKVIALDLGYTMRFVDGDNVDGYQAGRSNDNFSYGYAGLQFALGNKNKPHLSWHNPALEMYNRIDNTGLQNEVADLRRSNAELQARIDRMGADADGDGVADMFDKCAGTAKGVQVDGAGCDLPKPPAPQTTVIVTEEDRQVVREAIDNLEFEFGKATIRSTSHASLNRVAAVMTGKGFSLKLGGHTDNVGSDANNMSLSKRRAEAVKAYLVSQGVNPSKIEAVGYGEDQPIATNNTAAGRQQNRRVEFTLY